MHYFLAGVVIRKVARFFPVNQFHHILSQFIALLNHSPKSLAVN